MFLSAAAKVFLYKFVNNWCFASIEMANDLVHDTVVLKKYGIKI